MLALARRFGFGLAVVAGMVALLAFLPLILPFVAISEALDVRRLARIRCSTCGDPIGREAIRNAKRSAPGPSRDFAGAFESAKYRFIATWRITCPNCGREYAYHPNKRRAGLSSTCPIEPRRKRTLRGRQNLG